MQKNYFWRYVYQNDFKSSLAHNLNARKEYTTLFRQMKFNPCKVIKALNALHENNNIQIMGSGNKPKQCAFMKIDTSGTFQTHAPDQTDNQIYSWMDIIRIGIGPSSIIYLHNFNEACKQKDAVPIRIFIYTPQQKTIDNFINELPNGILKDFFQGVIAAQKIPYYPKTKQKNDAKTLMHNNRFLYEI